MLSAGHILAMDAKNLLDVVDCIRQRHSHIDWRSALAQCLEPEANNAAPQAPPSNSSPQHQETVVQTATITNQLTISHSPMSQTQMDDNEEVVIRHGNPLQQRPPDFRVNQPVTVHQTITVTSQPPSQPSSLPVTSNRVSALIQNYNLYGNTGPPPHAYGNPEQSYSSLGSRSIEEGRSRQGSVDGMGSTPPSKSGSPKKVPHPNPNLQASDGDQPIYSLSKKMSQLQSNNMAVAQSNDN